MNQFVITPAAGKRLIARATATHPAVQTALKSGTVVIVAGTTNGYVAEEILKHLGQSASGGVKTVHSWRNDNRTGVNATTA